MRHAAPPRRGRTKEGGASTPLAAPGSFAAAGALLGQAPRSGTRDAARGGGGAVSSKNRGDPWGGLPAVLCDRDGGARGGGPGERPEPPRGAGDPAPVLRHR